MKLTALLTIKNEEYYLKYCIENLIKQGFEIYLIDNGSEDKSLEIAKRYLNKGIVKIDHIDTGGIFKLEKILKKEEEIANSYESDWFMHTDADEIRLPHAPYNSIKEAIEKIDKMGYTAVNFNEFTFIPETTKNYIGSNYEKEMKYYYFVSSEPLRQIKLWKKLKDSPITFGVSGGHKVSFDGIRIYPNPFIMKHYIFLSKEHAIEKYSKKRKYNKDEVEKLGWHGWRANFKAESFFIPPTSQLKKLEKDNAFDITDPKPAHLFYSFEDKKEKTEVKREIIIDKIEKAEENNIFKKRKSYIRVYRILLSIYRRIVPFRIRQKIKNLILYSEFY